MESETPYKATTGVWSFRATILRYRLALAVVALALVAVVILAAVGVFSTTSSSSSAASSAVASKGDVTVFHAGSLVGLMDEFVAPAFLAATGYATTLSAKGSVALAKQLVAGTPADVFISADASVNDNYLLGAAHNNRISYYITFGRTALGLGYSQASPYSAVFDRVRDGSLSWYDALRQNPTMKIGRTDPENDPKGYRVVMLMELAQKYYNTSGLLTEILRNATNRQQIFTEENLETYVAAGDLDVGFFYEVEIGALSGVKFISLPEQIDLSNPALNAAYAAASYTNTETGAVYKGSASVYTVAVLNDAADKAGAEAFVEYILSPTGQTLLASQGMAAVNITAFGDTSAIPTNIASHLP